MILIITTTQCLWITRYPKRIGFSRITPNLVTHYVLWNNTNNPTKLDWQDGFHLEDNDGFLELTPVLWRNERLHYVNLFLGQLNPVEEIPGIVGTVREILKILDIRVLLGVTERNDLPIVGSLMDVPRCTGDVDRVLNPLFFHPTDGTFGVIDVDQPVPTNHLDGPVERIPGLPHVNLGGGDEGDETNLGSQLT